MKYLVLTNHSYMLWQFRKELIEKLAETGEVVIAMPFVGHEDDFKNKYRCIETKISRRSINPIKDLKLYSFYRYLIVKERPDMVITYSIKPNIYGGYACSRLQTAYCVNVQGLGTAFEKKSLAFIATLMYKIALKNVKNVFFENQGNADEFIKRRIIGKDRTTILNGAGVNLITYAYHDYPEETDGIHFLYLGRIMKEKGIDELITVMKRLKRKYRASVRFDMVGFFEDEYKEKIEHLEKKGIVKFHGFQSDPIPFYAAAHCVVLPSYHEGMSNVLLEAAAIGRAIITTDIPGCREAVENGVNGYLCKKMDVGSLEKALESFILLEKTQRKSMGLNGRIKMKREFDKEMIVKKTIEAISR